MEAKNILLVEGVDDTHVLGQLLAYHKVPYKIDQQGQKDMILPADTVLIRPKGYLRKSGIFLMSTFPKRVFIPGLPGRKNQANH